MIQKKKILGTLAAAMVLGVILASCFSSGKARETLPQTAVTIQRVRVAATLLGEIVGAENATSDVPMQVFIDNNKDPIELANGAETTILVNNGEHRIYAVLGNVESDAVRFNARSQTITVNFTVHKPLVGHVRLEVAVK
jgi:hypothetical protein